MDFGSSLFGDYRSRKAASSQRKWLQYMDNTKHQRNVADLRAAGLNPILSATGGSLGVPSAQMAQVPDYKTNSFQNYAAARQLGMQEALNKAQVNKINEETITQKYLAGVYGSQINVNSALANAHHASSVRDMAQAELSYTNSKLNSAQTYNVELESLMRQMIINSEEGSKWIDRYLGPINKSLDTLGHAFDTVGKGYDVVNPIKGMFKKKRVVFDYFH